MSPDLDQRLSPHFSLRELVTTHHRRLDNTPPPEVVERLTRLCVAFLEPVRRRFGPLYVSSGYRSPEVNAAVGGSRASAHLYGCAADFVSLDGHPTQAIVEWVVDVSGLAFDQVIDEYSSTANWVHLGIVTPVGRQVPRREALTMRRGRYYPFDRSAVVSAGELVSIVVNGRDHDVAAGVISYETVVALAGLGSVGALCTVTFAGGVARGHLTPGQSVRLEDGMVFSVVRT